MADLGPSAYSTTYCAKSLCRRAVRRAGRGEAFPIQFVSSILASVNATVPNRLRVSGRCRLSLLQCAGWLPPFPLPGSEIRILDQVPIAVDERAYRPEFEAVRRKGEYLVCSCGLSCRWRISRDARSKKAVRARRTDPASTTSTLPLIDSQSANEFVGPTLAVRLRNSSS